MQPLVVVIMFFVHTPGLDRDTGPPMQTIERYDPYPSWQSEAAGGG